MESLERTCKLGILTRPDGSVLYSEGETSVIAGIYGPMEAKPHKILIDKALVETHFRPKSGFPGIRDRFQESIIRNTCDTAIAVCLHPRASILIVIQELHDDGQLLASSLNAACLACLDSGIDMKCMFAAVSCYLDHEDNFSLTMTNNKDSIKASFTFAFDNVEEKVLVSHTEGSFTSEEYLKALYICRDQSRNVFKFYKDSVVIN